MADRFVALPEGADTPIDVDVQVLGPHRYAVTVDGRSYDVEAFATDRGLALRHATKNRSYDIDRRGEAAVVKAPGIDTTVDVIDARTFELRAALGAGLGALKPELESPMAGKVILTKVQAGDTVDEGDTLVIIEAMKMENEIRASVPAVVKEVRVKVGDLVNPGDVLLAFDLDAV